jgi:diaminopimelate epimerase
MVNVGNPHFVLFLDNDLEPEDPNAFRAYGLPWQELGALIATNPMFRYGTNVEFVRILNAEEIAFRIYERGCGPTQSSGTGTCASSAAAMSLRNTARTLTAHAEGGPQQVDWPTSNYPMHLTGPAEIICRGEVSAL